MALRSNVKSALVSHKTFRGIETRVNPPCRNETLGYFGWKFTRIKLTPIRNSVPSCNMAARTRSSS